MMLPSEERIEELRREFPSGCQVELIRMLDDYAPPVGTRGIVSFVDGVGTIHVDWQTGRSLGIAYGADLCRRVDDD